MVKKLHTLFSSQGAQVYYVELEADIETRLERNKTEHRLQEKADQTRYRLVGAGTAGDGETLPAQFEAG